MWWCDLIMLFPIWLDFFTIGYELFVTRVSVESSFYGLFQHSFFSCPILLSSTPLCGGLTVSITVSSYLGLLYSSLLRHCWLSLIVNSTWVAGCVVELHSRLYGVMHPPTKYVTSKDWFIQAMFPFAQPGSCKVRTNPVDLELFEESRLHVKNCHGCKRYLT